MQIIPTQLQLELLPDYGELEPPSYATEGAAGFDFRAAVTENTVLKPGSRALIPTALRVAVPTGYELQVRPRSGLALKYGLTVLNSPGTIDSDYRGEIKIILANLGTSDFVIERGMRIAQGVLCPVARAEFVIVSALDATERGNGGFGHTGV